MSQVTAIDTITQLAKQLKIDSIRCTTQAGSGHPTSSMSASDIMAVLLAKHLNYDFDNPKSLTNDRLIFSKGHASPLLYSLYKACGAISDQELMSLRKFGSRLEGHPVPEILPYVDVATGSLGQGLPMALGMAINGKYLDKNNYKVYVLLGDSEMAEGSVWEAMNLASYYKLDNLIAILDMNRLGQRGETSIGWNSTLYAQRASAFGFHTIEIDGHDINQIDKALVEAKANTVKPTFIIAKTIKGQGVTLTANKENWHGKPLNASEAKDAIAELGGIQEVTIKVNKPKEIKLPKNEKLDLATVKTLEFTDKASTREVYGDTLKIIGDVYKNMAVIDAEVSNSTYADKFKHAHSERFFEMFISEQAMLGCGIGLASLNKVVFASTFAAFLTRAYDFIRMGSICRSNLNLCGSHAGVSIGADGPSQMALEDIAMMRAIHGSTVLYPCDAYSAMHLVMLMANHNQGISYIRTTREKTPIVYNKDTKFTIGGSHTLKESAKDKLTLIAAGITVFEALKAYEELKSQNINVRVIDLYSIKPIDKVALHKAAKETGKFIVVEDHFVDGGIGDAVLDAFTLDPHSEVVPTTCLPQVLKLAVRRLVGSGTPEELMDCAKITAKHIVEATHKLLK